METIQPSEALRYLSSLTQDNIRKLTYTERKTLKLALEILIKQPREQNDHQKLQQAYTILEHIQYKLHTRAQELPISRLGWIEGILVHFRQMTSSHLTKFTEQARANLGRLTSDEDPRDISQIMYETILPKLKSSNSTEAEQLLQSQIKNLQNQKLIIENKLQRIRSIVEQDFPTKNSDHLEAARKKTLAPATLTLQVTENWLTILQELLEILEQKKDKELFLKKLKGIQ